MKIAVVGGTFDPLHNGHVAVCHAVLAQADVDRVLLAPAARSPFKADRAPAPARLRLEMIEAVARRHPRWEVSDLELHRPPPSYTIDTLDALSRNRPGDAFALVLGADQLPDFKSWKDYARLYAKYEVLATTRAGHLLPQEMLAAYPRLRVVRVPDVAVSATEVRRRLARGEPVDDMIPPEVHAVILREGLYQEEAEL